MRVIADAAWLTVGSTRSTPNLNSTAIFSRPGRRARRRRCCSGGGPGASSRRSIKTRHAASRRCRGGMDLASRARTSSSMVSRAGRSAAGDATAMVLSRSLGGGLDAENFLLIGRVFFNVLGLADQLTQQTCPRTSCGEGAVARILVIRPCPCPFGGLFRRAGSPSVDAPCRPSAAEREAAQGQPGPVGHLLARVVVARADMTRPR